MGDSLCQLYSLTRITFVLLFLPVVALEALLYRLLLQVPKSLWICFKTNLIGFLIVGSCIFFPLVFLICPPFGLLAWIVLTMPFKMYIEGAMLVEAFPESVRHRIPRTVVLVNLACYVYATAVVMSARDQFTLILITLIPAVVCLGLYFRVVGRVKERPS